MARSQNKEHLPFNKPALLGREIEYIKDSCQRRHLSGDGYYTKKSQALLEKITSSKKVLLTHSCTAALEMAALIYKISPGDEVILPSYTFVSTANAFVLRGAKPVFVDIRKDTLNMNENLIEELISEKTKMIVPVHYAGVSCEMDKILSIAEKHKIPVVEDSAQALGSFYREKPLGSLGKLATLSFHETKNCISGEGGALLINDTDLIEAAEIIREKGTNRSQFYKGQVDKYTWVDVGSSYLPSELIASFLYAQLENLEIINSKRKKLHISYHEKLLPLKEKGLITLPSVPEHCTHNGHLFYFLTEDGKTRDKLISYLKEKSITSVFHYIPLHSSPKGSEFHDGRDLPVTDSISSRLVRLPLYYGLSEEEQDRVIGCVFDFFYKKPQK